MYKACVKNYSKQMIIVESFETDTLKQFKEDLKNNDMKIYRGRIKTSDVYNWISENTEADDICWKYINKIGETTEDAYDKWYATLDKKI